ncbi:hypothetical protein [Paraburkholderia sp. ZP32-5]|uniref:hypothetical protein n=1 Tax=Paraburkholderia sp. ZP32-5 TaxID=2883245 RepID=UPI001F46E4E5|nr:hypothetical protein [Paraburkholderia sp. ZP32-5]
MATVLSIRSSANAPTIAKTALAQEIWLGVMRVPARKLDSATIALLERDLIGRRLSSMRRERVVGLDVFGALYIGSLRHVVKECPAFLSVLRLPQSTGAWCVYRHQHIVIEA